MPAGDLVYAGNPDTLEMGLWWKPSSGGDPRLLTTGVGDHTEPRLSADGRKLVLTLLEMRQFLSVIPARGNAAGERPLSDGFAGDLDPVMSPRGDRLLFDSSRLGHRNIWIARPDGTDPTPLTTEAAFDERPSFSPDGQQIAFVSDRSGQRGIWIMNTEGGAPRFVGAAKVLDTLTWSRDGRRILFARPGGGSPTLASISVPDGSVEPFATPGGAVEPAWSPTSDVLAYLEPVTIPPRLPSSAPTARQWLRFVDGQGRPLYSHLPLQSFTNGFLSWSLDGRRLAVAAIPANGAASIWIVEPDGTVPFRKLLDFPLSSWPRGITWTADGSSIIIAKQEPHSGIVLYDVNR